MSFQEKTKEQSLVEHLLGNADAMALTSDQVSRLRRAFRLQVTGTRENRVEAGRLGNEVRAELRADLAEALDNAKARGEKVVAFNDAGAMRIRDRDGLAALTGTGQITKDQGEAGEAYRYCAEFASAGLKSQLDYRVGSAALRDGNNIGLRSAAALQRAYVLARLAQMERAVAAITRDGRELVVLRYIAGEGHTLRSLGEGPNSRKANLEALKRALDAVGTVLPARGPAGQARIQSVHAALTDVEIAQREEARANPSRVLDVGPGNKGLANQVRLRASKA